MANKEFAQAIRLQAEAAKIHLSSNSDFETTLNGDLLAISKQTLESLIQPLVDKTITCCTGALKDAGLRKEEIDVVVMVADLQGCHS